MQRQERENSLRMTEEEINNDNVIPSPEKHVSFDLDNHDHEDMIEEEDDDNDDDDYMYKEEESHESMETDYLHEYLLPASTYDQQLVPYDQHETAMQQLNERWEIQLENTVEQSEEILHEQSRLSEEEREIMELRTQNEIQQAMSVAVENEEQMMVMKQEQEDRLERLHSEMEHYQRQTEDLKGQLKEQEGHLQQAVEVAIQSVQKNMEDAAKEETRTLIETFQSQMEHEKRRMTASTVSLQQQLMDTTEASQLFQQEKEDQIQEIIRTFQDQMTTLKEEIGQHQTTIQTLIKQESKTQKRMARQQRMADQEYKSIIQAMKQHSVQELKKANRAYETLLELQSSQLLQDDLEEEPSIPSHDNDTYDTDILQSIPELQQALKHQQTRFQQQLLQTLREKDAEHSLHIQEVILHVSETQRAIAQTNAQDDSDTIHSDVCHLKITKDILEQDLTEARTRIQEQQMTIQELEWKMKMVGEIDEFGSLQRYWESASSQQMVGVEKGLNNIPAVKGVGITNDGILNGHVLQQQQQQSKEKRTHISNGPTIEARQTPRKTPTTIRSPPGRTSSRKISSSRSKSSNTKTPSSTSPTKKHTPKTTSPPTNGSQRTKPNNSISASVICEIPSPFPFESSSLSAVNIDMEEISSVETEVVNNTSQSHSSPASLNTQTQRRLSYEKEPKLHVSKTPPQTSVGISKSRKHSTKSSHSKDLSSTQTNISNNTQPILPNHQKQKSPRVSDKHKKQKSQSRLIVNTSSFPKKRSRVMTSSTLSPTGRNTTSIPTRIMILSIPVNPEIRKLVNLMGASLVETISDASSATHVIAGGEKGFRRTSMMMIGLCSTSNILHVDWLWACFQAGKILPCTHHLLLKDRPSERKYSYSMRQTLRNGQLRRKEGGLLYGWNVYICKGVAGRKSPSEKDWNLLIDAAGGTMMTHSEVPLTQVEDPTHVLVITSDPPLPSQITDVDASRLSYEGAGRFTTTWLFDCILHQKLSGIKRGLGR